MDAVVFEKEEVTLESLELKYQIISVESQTLSQTLVAIPHRLPTFVADVKSFVKNMLTFKNTNNLAAIDTRKLEKLLPKQNYIALSEISVYVPPGMNKDWGTYLDAVSQSQIVVNKLKEETLEPTLRWIAALLTNPTALGSVRSRAGEYNIVLHDIDKVKKQISSCYSNQGGNSKVKYGDVFTNNQDVLVAMKRVSDINEEMGKINKNEIVELVNEITAALDKLLIRMKQNPDEYKISGVNMNDIAKFCFNLGREIEFFASHTYMLQSATQAMLDTKEKIDDILGN